MTAHPRVFFCRAAPCILCWAAGSTQLRCACDSDAHHVRHARRLLRLLRRAVRGRATHQARPETAQPARSADEPGCAQAPGAAPVVVQEHADTAQVSEPVHSQQRTLNPHQAPVPCTERLVVVEALLASMFPHSCANTIVVNITLPESMADTSGSLPDGDSPAVGCQQDAATLTKAERKALSKRQQSRDAAVCASVVGAVRSALGHLMPAGSGLELSATIKVSPCDQQLPPAACIAAQHIAPPT